GRAASAVGKARQPCARAGIDEYQAEASVSLPTSQLNSGKLSREAPAMSVPSEPFAAVYEDRNRLGVIVARTGRGGFEAYAADDHGLGLFPTPRAAAAAITKARPRDTRVISSATARTRLVSGTPMPQSPLSISLMVTQVTPRRCWSRCKSTPHHL